MDIGKRIEPNSLLRKGFDRLLARVRNIEHHRQLRNHKNIVDVIVDATELHLTFVAGVRGVCLHEHADGGTVQVGHFAQIDNELLVSLLNKIRDRAAQLVRLFTADERTLHFDNTYLTAL